MNVTNVKELQIIKRNVSKMQADIEIDKLLRSSTNDNGDEVAQFQADPFIADQFYMDWPKQKLPKEAVKGHPVALDLQGKKNCLSSYKMDDNHNRQECSTLEEADRPASNIPQSLPSTQPKVQPVNVTEVKTRELDSLLIESYKAYSLGQWGLAATKYRMAWELVTDSTLKLRLERINEDVVCYMLCLSLLETDQLNNLLEAVELLIALEKRSSHVFPAVYYALSKAHHKHYRFEMAKKAIEAGLAFLGSHLELTEYKIPGTDITLKESTKDGLAISLATMKDECSKWHPPDAVCRMGECIPSSRWYGPNRDIYFRDPAFNGMVVLTCNNTRNPCTLHFHQACWKAKKDQLSPLAKLPDKDVRGFECFTPNCEYGQGTRSLITRVEVYGDDAKLKTRFDPPANPVVWAKRQPLPKGAIPKQQVKPKRSWEKPRRHVVPNLPRSNCKEVTGDNREEKEWRLAKLAKLRRDNFGVKPGYEWRPDMEMYGNPQMMKIGDYLGGSIFENDSPRLAEIKKFLFSYFYEFIKENGCVKKEQIVQKWEDDKILFDNTGDVLDNETDICEFLLQSYKLVSLGDRIGIAENLPELYAVVRNEVCHCVRFVLTDPLKAQTAIIQEDTSNTVVGDGDEKKNKFAKFDVDTDTKDATEIEAPPATESFYHSKPECEAANEAMIANYYQEEGENIVPSSQQTPIDPSPWNLANQNSSSSDNTKSNNSQDLEEALIFRPPVKPENSKKLDKTRDSNPNDLQQSESNSSVPRHVLNSQKDEEEEDLVQMGVDSTERISPAVFDPPQESELPNSLSEKYVANHEPDSTTDCMTEMKKGPKSTTTSSNNVYSDTTQSSSEEDSPENTLAGDKNFPNGSVREEQDCETPMGVKIGEGTKKRATAQCQDTLTESNVQKIENDLAVMAKTVAQLRSVLDQNKTRSENHAQMLEQELMSHKIVSQESMSELIKDLNRLEARCTQLEYEKSGIAHKLQECERDLNRANEENVVLRLKNTEWMHKFDKLNEEKSDIEHNLNLLSNEKSAVENNLEALQRERDKMDKKLQKYHACIKEKIAAEQAISARKEEAPTEQEILEAARLSERKLKLQSLSHEFSINKYALEKALEKCRDNINMLNEVGNLIVVVTGHQFVMAETLAAWTDTDYYLRCKVEQYKEDYLKLIALLESDKQNENLDNIKLPVLNIVFPKPPNLMELYYKGQAKFLPPTPMPGLPWPMQGAHCIDPRYFSPPPGAFFPTQNLEHRPHDVRNAAAAGPAYPTKHYPRGPNDEVKGAGLPRDRSTESQKLVDAKFPQNDSSIHDSGNDEEGASQASSTNQMKKIGQDLLIEELRKKFVGVPEFDLMVSVQQVRKLHRDTLSGMRLQDIIREAEPIVQQLQAKHLALYLPSKQMLPPQRIPQQPNKSNQRKFTSSISSGQQNKVRGPVQEPVNRLANFPSKIRAASPSVAKKPAWAPVKSGLPEWKKNKEESECTICLDRMNLHPVYALPCQHSFHMKCIKGWLGENSVCPICRIHCTMDDEFPPLPS